jgi:peroxiredoxin
MNVLVSIVALLCVLSGCADPDRLILRGAQAGLEYDCSSLRTAASTAADRALLLDYAGRIVRYEEEDGNHQNISHIKRALDGGELAAVERSVVRYGCEYGLEVAERIRFPDRGSTAPGFTLPLLNGGATDAISLVEHRGEIVILNFFATWCAPCRQEYPELQEIGRNAQGRGAKVLIVLHRDRAVSAIEWTREHGGGLPILLDVGHDVSRAYRVRAIPQTVIIGKDGTVRRIWRGYREGAIRELLDEVLSES